jgi:VWFA-related protein
MDLKSSDIAVTDSGRAIDSRELRISRDAHDSDRLVTFIFDQMSAPGAKAADRIAKAVLRNLGEAPGAIGVWSVNGRLCVVQSYTADRNLVAAAITTATTGPAEIASAATAQEKLLVAAENAGDADKRDSRQKRLDRASIEALNEAIRVVDAQHAPWGIASLFAAAQAQRALAGRKAVIFFTEKIPSDLNAADQFRAASQRLRDASVSVYAVDLNALDVATAQGAQVASAMGDPQNERNVLATQAAIIGAGNQLGYGFRPVMGPLDAKAMRDTFTGLEFDGLSGEKNPLAQLAQATSGGYTSAQGNGKKLCRQIIADLTNYYTITYPEAGHPDGRFHPVAVKINRPGMRAQSDGGYFATADAAVSSGTAPSLVHTDAAEAVSLDTLREGAVDSEFSLRAAMLRFGKASAGIHSVLAVEIPIGQLKLHEDPNTALFSLHASLAAEVKDNSGKVVARFHEEFRRHESAHSAEKLRNDFLSMERSINLPVGDYTVFAMVRDWNADKLGSSTQTVHLAETGDADLLSDLVLVRSMRSDDEAGSGALPYGKSRVLPNLTGELSGEGDSASLYFQLYPDEKKPSPDALHLEVSKDGRLLATLPMKVQAVRNNEVSARVANVTLGSGSGTYQLTLCLDHDGRTTRRQLSVVSNEDTSGHADGATHEVLASFEPPSIELDLKTTAARQPAPQESMALVTDARERALAYTHSLPNFMCVESIDRSVDPKGTGVWKHRDSIVEMLRYADKNETRTVLEVNGQKSHISADNIGGARSNGEFGGILGIIFDPDSNADFEWQKTDEKDGQTLQVYSYKVDAAKSQFFLTDHSGTEVRAPFHGLVLIDNDTRAVRRLIAQTDELPKEFGIKASWMTIDYDYIAINGHDYLLPTSGEVGLKEGRSMAVSNRLRFSNYRRFGSHARILGTGPPITDKSPN